MNRHIAIIVPARYSSTRLPGKPLAMIAGKTMLQRVVEIAWKAAKGRENISVAVATDDVRIEEHCRAIAVEYIHTDPACASGTDRVASAMRQLRQQPDFILNLQGDAPLTPPDFLEQMIDGFYQSPCDVITPVTRLSWEELDKFRKDKKVTPFSGTCAVFDEETGNAFWFSKNIIPAIRKEETLRGKSVYSPVYRHIGLYGYSRELLEIYSKLPEGNFEQMEGLEQLRIIENGYTLRCVPVEYRGRASMSGVDSPDDIMRAEALIMTHGELV